MHMYNKLIWISRAGLLTLQILIYQLSVFFSKVMTNINIFQFKHLIKLPSQFKYDHQNFKVAAILMIQASMKLKTFSTIFVLILHWNVRNCWFWCQNVTVAYDSGYNTIQNLAPLMCLVKIQKKKKYMCYIYFGQPWQSRMIPTASNLHHNTLP